MPKRVCLTKLAAILPPVVPLTSASVPSLALATGIVGRIASLYIKVAR